MNVKAWKLVVFVCFMFSVSCLSFYSFVVVVSFLCRLILLLVIEPFLQHSFIIRNVVGYGQATLVMPA